MSVLGRLIVVGGGLVLGLLAAGYAASRDVKKIKSTTRGYRYVHRPYRRPDPRTSVRPRNEWS